jgi:two-component system, chemotaxis family, protein-glutamate methylesterase/glutaminase
MAEPIRVLVVDDSTFMRGALVRMIERSPQFKVIDTAVNGKEGVEKAQKLKPDVITMDIEMPIMNGIEALTAIMASTKTPVVMVSTLTESGAAITLQALEIGAVDFIPKSLTDKDKNIFKGAEEIHQKLANAAGVGKLASPAAQQATRPTVAIPAVSGVAHVNAKMVLIGSSTGGPKALQVVVSQLPASLPLPVVVAQHMPAQFTLALAKRLDEICSIKVVEAKHGDVLMPGTVYIAPGGMHMRLNATGAEIAEDKGESPYKPSVDVLAESAHKLYGKALLGVMLTGMGADGTKAFVQIKQAGGHIIAQDQATSVVYGMPRAVLEAGGVNEVLALDKIGGRIRALVG